MKSAYTMLRIKNGDGVAQELEGFSETQGDHLSLSFD